MKKCLPIIFAALLMVSALTGCASQTSLPYQNNLLQQNSLPEQSNIIAQSSVPSISQPATSTTGGSSRIVSSNASAAYEKLIAYKTEGYKKQSIADFNTALASTPDELTELLAAVADVGSTISHDDENYDFFNTTISFSSHELYCGHMGEELTFFISLAKESRPCNYVDEEGETVYDFTCFVEAYVAYSIDNPKFVTVAERDRALRTYKEEMQNYLNGLSEAEIVGGDIKKMLTDKSTELANSLSTENMKLSPCDIYMIGIHDGAEEVIR